jgi:hypothetical protein
MRVSRIPDLGPVVRQGPYLRRADGTELIDCHGIVDDTGVPLAVIKSEIEQKYLAGRHFYRHPGCFLIERDAYETWKRERLAFVHEHLHWEGGWLLFILTPHRSEAAEPVQPVTPQGAPSTTGGIRQLVQKLRHVRAESAGDAHDHGLPSKRE